MFARAAHRWAGAVAVCVCALALAGCVPRQPAQRSAAAPAGEESRLAVVVTLYPLEEFAREVGGDRVAVSSLLTPGVHAHDFEPTARDLERLLASDLFVYNGAGFEPWVPEVVGTLAAAPDGPRVLDASAGLALRPYDEPGLEDAHDHAGEAGHDHRDEHGHGHKAEVGGVRGQVADPHVWLDPLRALRQLETVRDALVELDPAEADAYRARAAAYAERLRALDREFAAALRSCRSRELVVQHASFGYLAERYGLRQVSVAGLAGTDEPGPRRLKELVEWMRVRKVTAMFYEQRVDTRLAEALAEEAGAETLALHSLENLTAEERARGETYLSLMRANLGQLVRGLGCAAPEG